MEAIEQETYRGYDIKIYRDFDAESPREWSNLGKMVCGHKGYNLPNEINLDFDRFESWDEVKEELVEIYDSVIELPLYLYDHSGIQIKVGSFDGLLPQGHAYFDSGQIGFIFCSVHDMIKEFGIDTTEWRAQEIVYAEKAEKILRNEVDIFDYYVAGSVYGFTIETWDGEEVCSSWGFYSDIDNPIKEAHREIDRNIEIRRVLRQDKLKQYIKHNVPLRHRILPNI